MSFVECRILNNGRTFHIENMSKAEFNKVDKLCRDRTNMAGVVKAVLLPIRTNTIGNIAKDLFLPLVCAIKVQEIGFRIFLSLLLLPLDVLTLPIRLVTLIPRAIMNCKTAPKKHPLSIYLEKHAVPMSFDSNTTNTFKKLTEGYNTLFTFKQSIMGHNNEKIYRLDLAPYEVPSFCIFNTESSTRQTQPHSGGDSVEDLLADVKDENDAVLSSRYAHDQRVIAW